MSTDNNPPTWIIQDRSLGSADTRAQLKSAPQQFRLCVKALFRSAVLESHLLVSENFGWICVWKITVLDTITAEGIWSNFIFKNCFLSWKWMFWTFSQQAIVSIFDSNISLQVHIFQSFCCLSENQNGSERLSPPISCLSWNRSGWRDSNMMTWWYNDLMIWWLDDMMMTQQGWIFLKGEYF